MPFISFEAIQQTQQGQHKKQHQDLTRIHSDPPALAHNPSISPTTAVLPFYFLSLILLFLNQTLSPLFLLHTRSSQAAMASSEARSLSPTVNLVCLIESLSCLVSLSLAPGWIWRRFVIL
jgi:hypothetical protein